MRTGKIGLRAFLFARKVPGIDDERCNYRQENQAVKHFLLECRLLNQKRRGLLLKESTKARSEGGGSLDIGCILTDGQRAEKAVILM